MILHMEVVLTPLNVYHCTAVYCVSVSLAVQRWPLQPTGPTGEMVWWRVFWWLSHLWRVPQGKELYPSEAPLIKCTQTPPASALDCQVSKVISAWVPCSMQWPTPTWVPTYCTSIGQCLAHADGMIYVRGLSQTQILYTTLFLLVLSCSCCTLMSTTELAVLWSLQMTKTVNQPSWAVSCIL